MWENIKCAKAIGGQNLVVKREKYGKSKFSSHRSTNLLSSIFLKPILLRSRHQAGGVNVRSGKMLLSDPLALKGITYRTTDFSSYFLLS